MALKKQYILFKSLNNSITIIIFKNTLNQKKIIKKTFSLDNS